MIFLSRYIAAQEERMALEDDEFKVPGALRFGSFRAGQGGDFATADEMIAAVDREMQAPDEFYALEAGQNREFKREGDHVVFKTAFPDGSQNDTARAFIRQARTAVARRDYRAALECPRRRLQQNGRHSCRSSGSRCSC